jgi:hypothetical protein
MKLTSHLFALVALLLSGSAAFADVIVFPANGQDAAQQQNDEGACFGWAKNQTGIDPMAAPVQAPTQATKSSGGAFRGAARAAAIGGIVDGSDGAKTGAKIGAAGGLMRQNSRNRNAQGQQNAQAEQAQSINSDNKATFDKAYGVCMQGKGYSVG